MEKAVGFGEKVWSATASGDTTGGVIVGVGSKMVELPMVSDPDRPRLTTVPATVTAKPPTEMMVPAMEKAVGFEVNVWPPTV